GITPYVDPMALTQTAIIRARAIASTSQTTTAQAIGATASALQENIVYPAVNGSLVHKDDAPTYAIANLSLSDFSTQVTFFNPYDRNRKSWDYGLLFRWTENQSGYLLDVDSNKNIALLYYDGSRNTDGSLKRSLADHQVIPNLDVSAQGSN